MSAIFSAHPINLDVIIRIIFDYKSTSYEAPHYEIWFENISLLTLAFKPP
jgi:hypothetical protein